MQAPQLRASSSPGGRSASVLCCLPDLQGRRREGAPPCCLCLWPKTGHPCISISGPSHHVRALATGLLHCRAETVPVDLAAALAAALTPPQTPLAAACSAQAQPAASSACASVFQASLRGGVGTRSGAGAGQPATSRQRADREALDALPDLHCPAVSTCREAQT